MTGRGDVVYDHIVFDLDGTLIDSRGDLVAAVNHVLRSLGLAEIAPETLCRYVGEGARVLVERALGPTRAGLVDEGLRRFMTCYGEHLLDTTRPYPGIVDLLAGLAARGVALSVLSNKPVRMSRAILDGLGLLPRFVAVIGGDSLPTRKPDPGGLEHLRALTGTPRERTLLVGDSAIDVGTARGGGVAFCGVAWGLVPDGLRATGAACVIARPGDLLSIVLRASPQG